MNVLHRVLTRRVLNIQFINNNPKLFGTKHSEKLQLIWEEMTQVLKLSGKQFRITAIKIFEEVRINTLEMNERNDIKSQLRIRGYEEEKNGNFRTEKCKNSNNKPQQMSSITE